MGRDGDQLWLRGMERKESRDKVRKGLGGENRREEGGEEDGRTGCWVATLSVLAVMGSGAWICCSTTEGMVLWMYQQPLLYRLEDRKKTYIDDLRNWVWMCLCCVFVWVDVLFVVLKRGRGEGGDKVWALARGRQSKRNNLSHRSSA